MAKSKIISASIAVDIQDLQGVTGAVQGLSNELSNISIDKNLEPRLKKVEKTIENVVKQISTMTDKMDVLSKIGGLDPKTLSDLSLLTSAISDVKIEVDALSAKVNNFSKEIGSVGDVGIKKVSESISKEIGNMASNIDTSITNATVSIQKGGEKLKKAYEQLLQSANTIVDSESVDASKIFKFSDEDSIDSEFKKVKAKLQQDLKDLADTTSKYNELKLNGASSDDMIKAAKAQVNALNKLKKSFEAFYGNDDFEYQIAEDITDDMSSSINNIIKLFPNLKGEAYRTFEEIYDFIEKVTENISNDFSTSINTIKESLKSVDVEVKEPAKKTTSEVKNKTKIAERESSNINTGVVIKDGVGAELIAELKEVINNLQKYVDKNPVELDAVINPTWGTNQTRKYLKSIKEQLSKTKNGKIDERLAERIYGLQDAFGKDFSDALNKSISKLKESLQKEGFSVGKLKIEDSAVKDFREQISNEIGAITVDINANILGTTIVDKDKADSINKQFEELKTLDKIDPEKIMDLVNAIKESGVDLDYSDVYKDRLKQIVKGLVDGLYGSVPEAVKKTRYPQGSNPLIGEFNDNAKRIKDYQNKINAGASGDAFNYYKTQLEKLLERQRVILSELSKTVEGVPEEAAKTIKDLSQKIDTATIEVSTATININNADATFTNINSSAKTDTPIAETISSEIKEVAKTTEATLTTTSEELKMLAGNKIKELISSERSTGKIDFNEIEKFVSDLKKVGIEELNPKFNVTTTGRIVSAMLKDGYASALEAFRSTTSHSKESQALAKAAQEQSKFFERFKNLYEAQSVQEKGTGSAKSIQMFVDAVRKSGVDFKIAPKYQDNEIGKIISAMLTGKYKTVSDALEISNSKSPSQNIDKANINVTNLIIKGQQNISNVSQKVTTANIEIKKGNVATSNGLTTSTKSTNSKNGTSPKLQSLINQYNQNIKNKDSMYFSQFLSRQEKILSNIELAQKNQQKEEQSDKTMEAEISSANSLESIDSKIGSQDSPAKKLRARKKESDDISQATENINNLLSETNTMFDRYKLFRSGKIYQTDYAHELSYQLYGADRRYKPGSARTRLDPHSTDVSSVGADTVEMIHNHPGLNLNPSLADILSWFSALNIKIDEINKIKDKYGDSFLDENSYHEFFASIVNDMGGYLRFDMSKMLNLDKDSRDQIKDKLLRGSIVSRLYEKKTGDDLWTEFLNSLLGSNGNLSILGVKNMGIMSEVKLKDLTQEEIDSFNKLYEYVKQNLDISDVISAKKNGYGSDYKYIDSFYDANIKDIDTLINNKNDQLILEESPALNANSFIEKYLIEIDKIISSTIDEKLKKQLGSIRDNLTNNISVLNTPLDLSKADNISLAQDAIKNIREGLRSFDSITKEINRKAEEVDGYLRKINSIKYTIKINEDKNLSKEAIQDIDNAKAELDVLENNLRTARENNDYSNINETVREKITQLDNEVSDAVTKIVAEELDIRNIISQIDNLGLNENKIDPKIRVKLLEYRNELASALDDDANQILEERKKEILKDVKFYSRGIRGSNKTLMGGILKELRHKNFQTLAQFFSIYDMARYLREAVGLIKEYDSALIEMMKVSDETRASLERYQNTLFDTADAIGSAALTLEKSTADWMRIGETLTEAAESAKAAQILMNVSEFQDINSATQALVSASQAYADLDKMDIVDKINKLGNEFPIATDQLATALQNSAAALTTQGNDLNEALALVVGGNVITQDALKTGTGIRTIALRIAGTKEAKDELAELGEGVDDFVVRTESKTRKLIMDYTAVASNGFKGVDVYNENGNLRSTYEIMQDIADIYKEIQLEDRQAGTNRANALVELLAGKNRSNIAASILTNPDTIREAYEAAQNAEGSAMRENEKYLTSVEAHMTMFKNAVDELVTSLIDSGFINDIIDFGTDLIHILKEITDTVGGMGTVIGSAGIIGLIAGGRNENVKKYFSEIFDNVRALMTNSVGFGTIKNAVDSGASLDLTDKIFSKKSLDYMTKNLGNVTKEVEGVATATESATIATEAFASAQAALIGLGVATALIVTAIAVSKYIKNIKEAQKATEDLARSNQKTIDSLDDYAKKIAKAKETIADERSSTDEIINAKNELIDIQNELNESYNNYNNIIQDINSSLEENTRQLIANRKEKVRETVGEAAGTDSFGINGNELIDAKNFYENERYTWGSQGSKVQAFLFEQFKEYFDTANPENYNGNGTLIRYDFKNSNPDDVLKAFKHMQQVLTQSEYEDSKQAQDALEYIKEAITQIEENQEKYSAIYKASGENEAINQYSSQYNTLMTAWLEDAEHSTEQTTANIEAAVLSLWQTAIENEELGIQYWLKSEYGDILRDIIASQQWNNDIERALLNVNQNGHNTRDFTNELSAEDILAIYNGENLNGKASELQIKLVDSIADAFETAGIEFADGLSVAVDKGLIRNQDVINFESELETARNKAIENGMSAEQFDKLNISTSKQLDIWKEIFDVEKDITQQTRMYYLAISDVNKALSASDILGNMQDQYKPAFDAMAEAYKAIWENGNYVGVDKVTSDQIASVRSQIVSLNDKLKEEGLDGIEESLLDDFILTLSTDDIIDPDFTDKAKEIQQRFDDLATAIVDNLAPSIAQASGATAELIQKQLTELGVTNAEAVVMTRLGYTAEQYAEAKEAAAEAGFDIDDDISSLSALEYQAISTNQALMDYYTGRILANGFDINTEEDVNALLNMADALGIVQISELKLADVSRKLAYANSLMAQGIHQNSLAMQRDAQNLIDETIAEVQAAIGEGAKTKYESAKVDGNKNKSSSTSSGSDSKQKFDWIERAIKKIQRAVTNLGKVADATYKTWGERLDAIMGKTEEFHDELGRYGAGNIDLYNRPQYINEDGSVSTVRSMSFGDESGYEILVPTIAFDNNGNPYSMSDDEAIARYYETGEYLGLFKSIEEAEEYAEKLHEQQEAIYTGNDSFYAGKYQKLKEEIALQEQAAQAYMAEAKAIGLSAEYVSKIQNGEMDIETVTDEKLKEAISDYQELYLNMQPYLMMVWKIILIAGNPQRQLHYNMTMKYA